eukprot:CAMPEP_0204333116 /NCGR_PEP_ID=MMETSP0469-20131031/16973_1 /ASSEMBLY_ACC=CAM_ASM_000384 /TAXON_ID=2969 /ORGANISM="Oxyrrhis marina" /LENGTH=66 /DNA_ID=CAMNT_0051316397 /DNA_START=60 /DNA_END=261 /DNA_ORIENTATION=-
MAHPTEGTATRYSCSPCSLPARHSPVAHATDPAEPPPSDPAGVLAALDDETAWTAYSQPNPASSGT